MGREAPAKLTCVVPHPTSRGAIRREAERAKPRALQNNTHAPLAAAAFVPQWNAGLRSAISFTEIVTRNSQECLGGFSTGGNNEFAK